MMKTRAKLHNGATEPDAYAQNQQAIAHVKDMTQQIKTKQIEHQGKISIAQVQERTKIVVALIQRKTAQANIEAEKELQTLGDSDDSAHDVASTALRRRSADDDAAGATNARPAITSKRPSAPAGQQASQQSADAQSTSCDHPSRIYRPQCRQQHNLPERMAVAVNEFTGDTYTGLKSRRNRMPVEPIEGLILSSTTDTQEQVNEAAGIKPTKQKHPRSKRPKPPLRRKRRKKQRTRSQREKVAFNARSTS